MKSHIFKLIMLYLVLIAFFSVMYIILSNLDVMQYLSDVFYYKMCMVLVLTFIVCFGCVYLVCRRGHGMEFVTLKDGFLALVFAFLLNFSFLSLIIVSLDRSISVWLISYMAAHPEETYCKEDMERVFWKGYIKEYEAMERRIKEQLVTKTIEPASENGRYRITSEGIAMVEGWKLIGKFYPIDERFLYPECYLSEDVR